MTEVDPIEQALDGLSQTAAVAGLDWLAHHDQRHLGAHLDTLRGWFAVLEGARQVALGQALRNGYEPKPAEEQP